MDQKQLYESIISISLNNLVQEELKTNSSLCQEIKSNIAENGTIPKSLVFEVLKQHLTTIDQQKPTLIVDRKIFVPKVEQSGEHEYTTVIPVEDPQNMVVPQRTEEHGSNESLPNGHCENLVIEEPAQTTKTKSLKTFLRNAKNVVFGESQPVPDVTNEDKDGNVVVNYLRKMKGGQKRPPYEKPVEALLSFITSFVGIGILTSIDYYLLQSTTYTTVIGAFGATAVLLFSAIKSPLAQPRNLIFGHIIGALIGVTMQQLLGTNYPWLAAALAVSLTIGLMCLTCTVHPPAGATAIIAVYSDQKIHSIGFLYTFIPVLVGAFILLIVALVMNNLFPSRRYPVFWL